MQPEYENNNHDEDPLMEEVHTDNEPMPDAPPIREVSLPEAQVDDDILTGESTFTINKVTSDDRHNTPDFEAAGYLWNLLIFPRGKDRGPSLGIFLNAAGKDQPFGWQRRGIKFSLAVVNQLDPSKSVVKDTDHSFTSTATDWGFNSFMPLGDLCSPGAGFLDDNQDFQIRVVVKVDKTDSPNYNSKAETGCVGLKNQGATCYMNSLLQTLFHINSFRKAVYAMPTQQDATQGSIPLALQTLFYKLQFGDMSVSTKDLTRSFGWDYHDAFMQHDVQELNRVLVEKLEERMKGTKVEGYVNKHFEGTTINYIACLNVDYKSEREEAFQDLQLNVKGCKDVYDSFDEYCEPEVMDGQNQYQAEGHGLQDAKRGVLFKSFPPVLFLQLKRFEFDYERGITVKINDRYEFPDVLDLDREDRKYLSPTADRSVRNKFKLHSVLVHSGGMHGGHYYSYSRAQDNRWLKFDDDKVTKQDQRRAMTENFGGADDNNSHRIARSSNAYLLVYIRDDQWSSIMEQVAKDAVADHVQQRLQSEQEAKERKKREKDEAPFFTHVCIVTGADMQEQVGHSIFFDLVDYDKVAPERKLRVRKDMKWGDLRQLAAEQLSVPVGSQRFWTWAKRQNGTYRPNEPLSAEADALKVEEVQQQSRQGLRDAAVLDVFLEVGGPKGFQAITPAHIMVFLKAYNPASSELRYIGHMLALGSQYPAALLPLVQKMSGLGEASGGAGDPPELQLYEEIKSVPKVMCDPLQLRNSLQQQQCEHGDIFIVQPAPDPHLGPPQWPTVREFLRYQRNKLFVTFKRLLEPKEEGEQVQLSREHRYADVARAVAAQLQIPHPERLRFTHHNSYQDMPMHQPVRWKDDNILVPKHAGDPQVSILFYEVLPRSLELQERLKDVQVRWHGAKAEVEREYTVWVPREATVSELTQELRPQLDPAVQNRPIRCMDVHDHKIMRVYGEEDRIQQSFMVPTIDAEAVPPDQEALGPEDMLWPVCHYTLQHHFVTEHSTPFLVRIAPGEHAPAVQERMRQRLGTPAEEFNAWPLSVVSANAQHPVVPVPQDLYDQLLPMYQRQQRPEAVMHPPTGLPSLGLEHAEGRRRPLQRYNPHEKPITIRGT